MRSFDAVIFDMDGTLVDNMPVHMQAWLDVLRGRGLTLDEHFYRTQLAGRKSSEIVAMMLGDALAPHDAAELAHTKERRYRELYANRVTPLGGAPALLARLRAAGIACAVATAAPRANRDMVLKSTGLESEFAVIVDAEHGQADGGGALRGKPHPDLYLAAARALGVSPAQCLVFEDAENGVAAAIAAGMQVAGITTFAAAPALRAAGARWILRDFTDLPEELLSLLGLVP